jgi:hypothetical protein
MNAMPFQGISSGIKTLGMTQLSLTVSSKSPNFFQTFAWIRADSKVKNA